MAPPSPAAKETDEDARASHYPKRFVASSVRNIGELDFANITAVEPGGADA